MLFYETLIILFSIISISSSLIIFIKESLNSPIQEPIILTFATILLDFSLLFYLLTVISFSPTESAVIGIETYKIGAFLFYLSESFIMVTFILPTFSVNYKSIFLIAFNFSLFISVALINYFTIDVGVADGMLVIKQSLITLLGITLLLCFVFIVFQNRYSMIKKITHTSNQNSEKLSFRFYIEFYTLVGIYFILISIRSVLNVHFYGFLYLLPVSLLFLLTGFNFRKIRIWFVTDAVFHGIIIADKNSGVEIYSKLFLQLENKDYITSFLKAMNITTQKMINSEKPLEVMAFADKVILAVESQFTVSFMLCSEWNLSTYSITKYIAKMFEKSFSRQLKNYASSGVLNKKEFLAFDNNIEKVRNYLPL